MDNNEKKWCYKAALGAAIGFCIGFVVKYILGLFLVTELWQAILTLIIPAFMIMGLIIIHGLYQREKDKNF